MNAFLSRVKADSLGRVILIRLRRIWNLIIWFLPSLLLGNPPCMAENGEPIQRLNVVFILTDDLGWGEVGCYGQEKIPTPNIDRLAAEGMRFTQHYSGAPVCAPARCVLMTGKHLGQAEVRGNRQARATFPEFTEGQHPLSEEAITLATVFRRGGKQIRRQPSVLGSEDSLRFFNLPFDDLDLVSPLSALVPIAHLKL